MRSDNLKTLTINNKYLRCLYVLIVLMQKKWLVSFFEFVIKQSFLIVDGMSLHILAQHILLIVESYVI